MRGTKSFHEPGRRENAADNREMTQMPARTSVNLAAGGLAAKVLHR